MANWPGYADAFAGSGGITNIDGTIAETLPPIFSSASGSQAALTGTMAETLPSLDTFAQGGSLSPITGTMAETLPSIRSGVIVSQPFPTVLSVTKGRPYYDLTHAERAAYRRALLASHRVRCKVDVFDGNERIAHSLDVSDGQIDLDITSDVTRSVSLTILDPRLKFSWSPMGDVYLDKQIGITYGVEVRELGYWVEVPVFRGPVTGYSRKGPEVSVEAQGKENLMLPPVKQLVVPSLVTRNEVQQVDINNAQNGDSFRLIFGYDNKQAHADGNAPASDRITLGQNYDAAGIAKVLENFLGSGKVIVTNVSTTTGFKVQFAGRFEGVDMDPLFVVDATGSIDGSSSETTSGLQSVANRHVKDYVRRVASQYGERFFDMGEAGNVSVPKTFALDPAKAQDVGVWKYLLQVADSADLRLFYDGRGYLCLRDVDRNRISHTFDEDLLTEPEVRQDLADVRNQVDVYGQDKKGHDVLKARVRLPRGHPLSPESLGRNGKPRVLLDEIKLDNTHLTIERAKQIGNRHLDQRTKGSLDVNFDALPVPHLEGGDLCVLIGAAGEEHQFTVRTFSLPLGPASMSIGYHRAKPIAKFRSKSLPVGKPPPRKRKAHHR